jgi:hypothetical protein
MKRFLTFALLGPLLGIMLLSLFAIATLQVLPSLMAGGVGLAPFPPGLRMLVCALAGMTGAGAIVSNYRGYMGMFVSGADIAAFVAASAMSAVVCAWLSRANQPESSSDLNAGE